MTALVPAGFEPALLTELAPKASALDHSATTPFGNYSMAKPRLMMGPRTIGNAGFHADAQLSAEVDAASTAEQCPGVAATRAHGTSAVTSSPHARGTTCGTTRILQVRLTYAALPQPSLVASAERRGSHCAPTKLRCAHPLAAMKFGKDLQQYRVVGWEDCYIDYKGLKIILNGLKNDGASREEIDAQFFDALEESLEHVSACPGRRVRRLHASCCTLRLLM